MRKMLKMSIAAAMVMGIGSVSAQADGINILSNVQAKGELRLRYENVDTDDGVNGNANAYTSRLTVGASADLLDTDWLSAYVEMTNVANLNNNYNDLNSGNPNNKDIVVDPEQTRLTQSYIDAKYGDTNLRIGRQMINLDNQRFVGAVGWRQMFQTFDAITLTNKSIENLNIFASYITRVNAVKYEAKRSSRDLLINVSYKVMPELKVTAYSYMLGTVHDTFGIALTGKVGVSDDVKLSYRAEYATQSDPSMENKGTDKDAVNADADYFRLELGASVSDFSAGIGYEELSGASGSDTTFTTPYATLHGQNGWADTFLGGGGNPPAGLEDLSFNVGYNAGELGNLKVVYHDYSSEVGSTDFGTEINAVYKNKVPGVNGVTGMLKYADFDADSAGYVDNTKIWLMLGYKFASK